MSYKILQETWIEQTPNFEYYTPVPCEPDAGGWCSDPHDCVGNKNDKYKWAGNSHYVADAPHTAPAVAPIPNWLDRNPNASISDIIGFVHQQAPRKIKNCKDVNSHSNSKDTLQKKCQEASEKDWKGDSAIMYNDPTIGVISDDDQRDIINRCKSKRLLFDVDAHINFCYWDTKDDACKSSTNEESQISSHCKKFG